MVRAFGAGQISRCTARSGVLNDHVAVPSRLRSGERWARATTCARVAAPGVRLVLLTHEIRLLERVLGDQTVWRVEQEFRVFHGGHYPRVYLLSRG